MSKHLDYAEENFREAWRNANADPSTIQALTRGGRALVRVAADLEQMGSEISELRAELASLRVEFATEPVAPDAQASAKSPSIWEGNVPDPVLPSHRKRVTAPTLHQLLSDPRTIARLSNSAVITLARRDHRRLLPGALRVAEREIRREYQRAVRAAQERYEAAERRDPDNDPEYERVEVLLAEGKRVSDLGHLVAEYQTTDVRHDEFAASRGLEI